MQRPIKFRAWDKEEKRYWYSDKQGTELGEALASWLSNLDRYVVEQFTGILDKNGKEIYEGDVLREAGFRSKKLTTGEETPHVPFVFPQYEEFSGGGMDYGVWGIGYCFNDGDAPLSNSEVIGNVFENPSLVGGEKE